MSRRILVSALLASLVTNACLLVLWRDAITLRTSATIPPSLQPRGPGVLSMTAPLLSARLPRNETEFTVLRTQLESLGLPQEIVRSALLATMNVVFRQKRDAAMAPFEPHEYWRTPHRRPEGDRAAAEREMQRQWNMLKRQLIGDDFEDDPTEVTRRFGHLPPEKVARLRTILADYSDLEKELYVSEVDSEGLEHRAIARERRADIERLLTPEELVGYDLRNSPASDRLRNRLGNFAATEAEFRALYPTFKAVTRDLSDPDWVSG